MLTVVGGVYRERCMRPHWDEMYGSAGRAATAIARLEGQVELHSYLDPIALEVTQARALGEGFALKSTPVTHGVAFQYTHGLVRPRIWRNDTTHAPIKVSADKVLRYGMLEGTAVVTADYAVYDPQNVHQPEPFNQNGSTAKHLALILNRYEAGALLGEHGLPPQETAARLATRENAEVVIIKMGPMGAFVYSNGSAQRVPAYSTTRVWKIGTGDQFVANFAYAWMEEGRDPVKAADRASRATAFYCQHNGFPTPEQLDAYQPDPIQTSERFGRGERTKVYLAGPFFTLGQLWVVEQARNCLRDMGLDVFSPYHDVGPGPAASVVPQDLDGIRHCDVLLAIGDGLDSGTVYEIGFARCLGKPVVVYVENESAEDCKMMAGSDCFISDDFVSAIYQTAWVAASL